MRPGPKPKSSNELLFWESEWYVIFRAMRGEIPSARVALGRRRYKELVHDSLEELKRLHHTDPEKEWFRQFNIAQLEQWLKPRKPVSNRELWGAIVRASSGDEMRRALKKYPWHWCGRTGYPALLDEHADLIVRSKNYIYYPKAGSSSADRKRVLYFARAMAGICCGLSGVTGWDRLYKLKREHGAKCLCPVCEDKQWERLEESFYGRLAQIRKSD